ncbi:hypothetical protein MHK_004285 [Candidatus Magnetomorum sp. HK-1]|nr:hypothetical protein MHK_004285 [Candidatus Magnetomorum sp. HK-1]
MQLSDWLTILFSILGVSIAAVISWIFFRAQQKTDYVKIRELLLSIENQNNLSNSILHDQKSSLDQIKNNVQSVKDLCGVNDKIDLLQQLNDINKQVGMLGGDVSSLVEKITLDIKSQQRELLDIVQQKFYKQVLKTQDVLLKDLEKEILITRNGNMDEGHTLTRIVDLIGHVLNSLGEFQRANIQEQSSIILTNVKTEIGNRVDEVFKEVTIIKKQMDNLPLALAK